MSKKSLRYLSRVLLWRRRSVSCITGKIPSGRPDEKYPPSGITLSVKWMNPCVYLRWNARDPRNNKGGIRIQDQSQGTPSVNTGGRLKHRQEPVEYLGPQVVLMDAKGAPADLRLWAESLVLPYLVFSWLHLRAKGTKWDGLNAGIAPNLSPSWAPLCSHVLPLLSALVKVKA